jgi:hypothetical protein
VSVECDRCGAVPEGDGAPLPWVSSLERGQLRWYCERCARANLRAIEGKLDSEWW